MTVQDATQALIETLLSRLDLTLKTDGRLSTDAGLDRRYLSQLRRKRTDMTLSSFLRLCRAADVAPSDLFGASEAATVSSLGAEGLSRARVRVDASTVDDLLDVWSDSKGHIEALNQRLLDEVVIFSPPRQKQPVPVAVGRNSFAATLLEEKTPESLSRMIRNSQRMLVHRVAESHLAALQGKPILTIESGKYVWSGGVTAVVDYVRLLLPLRDAAGKRYILNYSKQIGSPQKPPDHPGE